MNKENELWQAIIEQLKHDKLKSGQVWPFKSWVALKNKKDYFAIWEKVIDEKCREGYFEKDFRQASNCKEAYNLKLLEPIKDLLGE